jgi:hypothetical protein
MGDFTKVVDGIAPASRFISLDLQQMFATPEEQSALAHVQQVLRQQTDDVTAVNSLITKGGAVLGVVAKLLRSATTAV